MGELSQNQEDVDKREADEDEKRESVENEGEQE